MEVVEFILEFILSKIDFHIFLINKKRLLEEDTYKQLNDLILYCHHCIVLELHSIHLGYYMAWEEINLPDYLILF